MEVIPHVDFWRELPELTRDGCIYTWQEELAAIHAKYDARQADLRQRCQGLRGEATALADQSGLALEERTQLSQQLSKLQSGAEAREKMNHRDGEAREQAVLVARREADMALSGYVAKHASTKATLQAQIAELQDRLKAALNRRAQTERRLQVSVRESRVVSAGLREEVDTLKRAVATERDRIERVKAQLKRERQRRLGVSASQQALTTQEVGVDRQAQGVRNEPAVEMLR
ncbi:hypothetical protein KIPB_011762, partial [Kipferlia bialata]|eukprot:g11762.t1